MNALRRLDRPGWWGAFVGLLCGLLALGPGLAPGYLLFYDMVFVPDPVFDDRLLGTDGSVPRAVPNDLLGWALTQVVPGWLAQKVILLLVFVGVGAGVARFFRSRTGAVAAAVAAAWNPYVGERLAIGHTGFLLGYATLPFLALAAAASRRGEPRSGRRLVLWTLVCAATGSTGAVIGLLVVLCVLFVPWAPSAVPPARRLVVPVGAFLLANSTWWFPYLVLAPSDAADPAGVEAFMSRSDTPFGVLLSVFTGGGIWNRGTWFADRGSVLVAGAALVGLVVCLVVAARAAGRRLRAEHLGLVVAGGIGLVVAVLSALPGGATVLTALVTNVPGLGLLRDSQKFVAPWMIVAALAVGCTAQVVRDAATRAGVARASVVVATAVVAFWPVATFSGMAWGAGGAWRAAHYPESMTSLAQEVNRLEPQRVAIFPWNLYRRYDWNHDVVVLDPWQRMLDTDVVVNDDLPLSDRVVAGESPNAARISRAFADGTDVVEALQRSGVQYVVVQRDQPRLRPAPTDELTLVAKHGAYELWRVPDVAADRVKHGAPDQWWRFAGWAGPVVLLGAVGGRALGFGWRRRATTS